MKLMKHISASTSNRPLKTYGNRMSNIRRWKETGMGYFFIGPLLIGLTILTLVPIIASFVLSLSDWNLVQGIDKLKFSGIKNYEMLSQDSVFLKSMRNNFIFILTVPIILAFSLILAVLINKHVYFKSAFKVIYFMPYISSIVAVAIVYQVLFHPSYGPVNEALKAIGVLNPPLWLADTKFALYSVMGIMVWIAIGYNLIIYTAGLQAIPRDLYEASDIDGASGWQKFIKITIPMLSPTTFFLMVTGVIGSFKVFDLIAVLTSGGPSYSTSVMVYYLYEQAFVFLKTGYSSAVAVVLLLCVLAITYVQFILQKKWVNY
jgi:multiple sugar transport system permease protein